MLKVIDIWAPWCGPCKMMMPTIEKLAAEFNVPESNVTIEKINADDNPALVKQYGVMGIPTLIFEKEGEVVARFVGVKQEKEIREEIQKFAN